MLEDEKLVWYDRVGDKDRRSTKEPDASRSGGAWVSTCCGSCRSKRSSERGEIPAALRMIAAKGRNTTTMNSTSANSIFPARPAEHR